VSKIQRSGKNWLLPLVALCPALELLQQAASLGLNCVLPPMALCLALELLHQVVSLGLGCQRGPFQAVP